MNSMGKPGYGDLGSLPKIGSAPTAGETRQALPAIKQIAANLKEMEGKVFELTSDEVLEKGDIRQPDRSYGESLAELNKALNGEINKQMAAAGIEPRNQIGDSQQQITSSEEKKQSVKQEDARSPKSKEATQSSGQAKATLTNAASKKEVTHQEGSEPKGKTILEKLRGPFSGISFAAMAAPFKSLINHFSKSSDPSKPLDLSTISSAKDVDDLINDKEGLKMLEKYCEENNNDENKLTELLTNSKNDKTYIYDLKDALVKEKKAGKS